MNGERPPDGPNGPAADDPIADLEQLDHDVSPEFVQGVRNKVERRRITGHFVVLSWDLPRVIVLEFLELVFQFVDFVSDSKGGRK